MGSGYYSIKENTFDYLLVFHVGLVPYMGELVKNLTYFY